MNNLPAGPDPANEQEWPTCQQCQGDGCIPESNFTERVVNCPTCKGSGVIEPEGSDGEYDHDEEEARGEA